MKEKLARLAALGARREIKAAAVFGGLLAAASSSHALTVADVQPVIDLIVAVVAVVSAIGLAVMSVVVTAMTFKWARAALR